MSTTNNKVTGYLSRYKGSEIDATVERVQGLDAEFALKADKSLKINGHDLAENFDLTAEDVGAVSVEVPLASEITIEDGNLVLKDVDGNVISSVSLEGVHSKTYVYEQGVASSTWVITHNLGKFPSVTLVDSAGTVFNASVKYDSPNQCTVEINGATTGKAYLN